jgi:hypothetical protein
VLHFQLATSANRQSRVKHVLVENDSVSSGEAEVILFCGCAGRKCGKRLLLGVLHLEVEKIQPYSKQLDDWLSLSARKKDMVLDSLGRKDGAVCCHMLQDGDVSKIQGLNSCPTI